MTVRPLFPEADTSVRCADFSREIRLDPGGTALAVDEIVVADLPLPWPKPVFDRPGYERVPDWATRAAGDGRRVRVVGAAPLDDMARQVEVTAESDGKSAVLVGADGHWWEVEVTVAREVPTIACGAPGGLPTRPGIEYRVAGTRVVV